MTGSAFNSAYGSGELNILIRPEIPTDINSIFELTEAAFLDNAHSVHTEQFIVNELRRAGALTISLVGELQGVVVGHVALSPVAISSGAKNWFGLGPISVSPVLQGKGIGASLMKAALAQLSEMGAAGCVLVGEPSYYSRFGFRAEKNLVYCGVPPEYFLALSFSKSMATGTVTYHSAFEAKTP